MYQYEQADIMLLIRGLNIQKSTVVFIKLIKNNRF